MKSSIGDILERLKDDAHSGAALPMIINELDAQLFRKEEAMRSREEAVEKRETRFALVAGTLEDLGFPKLVEVIREGPGE